MGNCPLHEQAEPCATCAAINADIDRIRATYIGDGVYVEWEGNYQLWLWTEREGRKERIALGPAELMALVAIARQHWSI